MNCFEARRLTVERINSYEYTAHVCACVFKQLHPTRINIHTFFSMNNANSKLLKMSSAFKKIIPIESKTVFKENVTTVLIMCT